MSLEWYRDRWSGIGIRDQGSGIRDQGSESAARSYSVLSDRGGKDRRGGIAREPFG